ncbi:DUF2802 domain-containing protein [Maribrevibacterium harenarium]|uniref:DUF2802 domain-containing protein n=1 Tax=Maribrevibacterium harenarium TaxID=2589817 RepID=A0A501X2L0_9GAMM|nr:DUF2802 domain-containing protein [Maribrevibacterium harenarium]TPE54725.1 DUF2802 domain-containing protein [Maribrevibacterium harenarium]
MDSQWIFNFLLVFQFLVIVMLVVWLWRVQRRLNRIQDQQSEAELGQKKQVQVLASGSIGMGRRLVAIEKRLNMAVERQSEIISKEGSVSYNRAMELLEMGATVDDLVSKCGLIRAEAELISLLKKESRLNSQSSK